MLFLSTLDSAVAKWSTGTKRPTLILLNSFILQNAWPHPVCLLALLFDV